MHPPKGLYSSISKKRSNSLYPTDQWSFSLSISYSMIVRTQRHCPWEIFAWPTQIISNKPRPLHICIHRVIMPYKSSEFWCLVLKKRKQLVVICQKIDDEIYQSQTYHFSKIPPTNYSFTFILPISIAFRMLSYIQRQEEFSVPAIQCTYTYKENYTQGTSILVFANRANKSSPANNCVLFPDKAGRNRRLFRLIRSKRNLSIDFVEIVGHRLSIGR